MATSSIAGIDQRDITSFQNHLRKSKRILALCGAGLSAASGLPTFRGAGGLWRTHEATSLATPEAWRQDSGLVWQFYNYRRHMALQAQPNAAHFALAELARKNPDFQCLSQNVDGLSQRADHPRGQLQLLHGTLFNVKCDTVDDVQDGHGSAGRCNYVREDFNDPFSPVLATPTSGVDPTSNASRQNEDISDAAVSIPKISRTSLPNCPECKTGVLRPGVVWFGEALPEDTIRFVNDYIYSDPIDLVLVIGTSATVYPAAGYIYNARSQHTRVAVINMEPYDRHSVDLEDRDWYFCGDASVIVPELLKPIIGEVAAAPQSSI